MPGPLDMLLRLQPSEGAHLDGCVIRTVDTATRTAGITFHGVDVEDVPYAGGAPVVGQRHWVIREATTLVILS